MVDNRFAVERAWRETRYDTNGAGFPKRVSELDGAFASSDPPELDIRIEPLDFPDRILALPGELSNLARAWLVTDTRTGTIETRTKLGEQY